MTYKKKLIEVALPLDAINRESAREKSIRHGHPSTLHLWWARRPLAAARAVLWASLVDDPSAHRDEFPTDEAEEVERQRLFRILEELVKWENSNNERVLEAARAEIVASCDGDLPNTLDPFCGGGTIPLEAQRLGLPAYGGDLNPVAVLISKATVEIPPRFAGLPPVNPVARENAGLTTWERAQGLAEDVRFYGRWMRERAFERIGHLYPRVRLPAEQGGGEATVIAWIWARTVESPDPSWSGHVPLVRSWLLRKGTKTKPAAWVEPNIDRASETVSCRIREGGMPPDGTVNRGRGTCLATGTVIPNDYIRAEAVAGRMDRQLIAIVCDGEDRRVYLPPDDSAEFDPVTPQWKPDEPVFAPHHDIDRLPMYGMPTWGDAFSDRQLTALTTFSDLLREVRTEVLLGADAALPQGDLRPLHLGGSGALAYADAIVTYLAFVVDKCADYWSTVCSWHTREYIRNTFARQAIPMTWDYAEANPFSDSTGNWLSMVEWVWRSIEEMPALGRAQIAQRDAQARLQEFAPAVVSTDPPYYDNVSYADLSDFFYVWIRRNLRNVWPDELSTVLTPKASELIANRYRAGSVEAANRHFEAGMAEVFATAAETHDGRFPITLFYAFKQAETDDGGTASTGWEIFLESVLKAGLSVDATWPMRTEMGNRMIASGTAALASSIVLSCRPRSIEAPLATRAEFLAALRNELPDALRLLQRESIAPVDMAQSAIGPGMAVFSRYSRVVESDGSTMSVRQALMLINEVLQEALSEEETEYDGDTRWALTWFEQHGTDPGPYGDAETLSKAKNTSVDGVIGAGIAIQLDGKVRLLRRDEVAREWDPTSDSRLTVWEVTQHLIVRLGESESAAAELLRRVGGGIGERARQLSYLLYQIADRRGWSEEAVAYNSLVQAWPDLSRLAGRTAPVQQTLGE